MAIQIKQQMHKGCGGEIIIVSSGNEYQFLCKECQDMWELPIETGNNPHWTNIKKKDGVRIKIN